MPDLVTGDLVLSGALFEKECVENERVNVTTVIG
jgi:hypothetical protein